MINLLRLLPLIPLLVVEASADGLPPRLVPMPKSLTAGNGFLKLTATSRICFADAALEPLANVLAEEIYLATGVRLAVSPASRPDEAGAILLKLDSQLTNEAYRLEVDNTAIVTGGNYQSVASGTVTLLQSLQNENGSLTIPQMRVTDAPSYSYRGAMLDLARKYHSPGGIEQVITLCRMYKIRFLHLHLSDDQLFMFPSTRFPQVGKTNSEFARFEPASQAYSAPYSLDELKSLEKFAQERGVYLVPEIDLPGHSGRLIADAPEIFGMPGNGSTVNIASDRTFAALTVLLNEVMDVFESSPYIHLGGDEVSLAGLRQTKEYQEAEKTLGRSNISEQQYFHRFIAKLHGVAAERGKRAIVWEEAWKPDGPDALPKDAAVMIWTHGRNPQEVIEAGYDVINATWTPLYIVRNDKRPMEFIFDWQVPMFGQGHLGNDRFTTVNAKDRILGPQLCSWENSENIEIQSMRNRLALVGEKAWNPEVGGKLADFERRLANTDAILDRIIHPIKITVKGNLVDDENTFTEPITINLEPRQKGLTLKYTLDNSLPNENWKHYDGPITVERTVHLRAGLFDDNGQQHGNLVGAWYRGQIPVKPNLATGKPVTVGPTPDRNDSWSAKVAVDGKSDDADAHWASEGAAPQWLRVDLGEVQEINTVKVITYWDGGRYYQLNAEVSEDGETWTKVLDFSNDTAPATADGYSATFPATLARYVKVNMLKNSANPFVHIVELIVDGPEK